MRCYAIPHCGGPDCPILAEHLVRLGYFPSSPEMLSIAFSFEILESHVGPNAQAAYPVNAFREGLVDGLRRHGVRFQTNQPFKNQLPEALTWFDALKLKVEYQMEDILSAAAASNPRPPPPYSGNATLNGHTQRPPSSSIPTSSPKEPTSRTEQTSENAQLQSGIASTRLRNRCPACFGQRH
jgi:hypothetical protein